MQVTCSWPQELTRTLSRRMRTRTQLSLQPSRLSRESGATALSPSLSTPRHWWKTLKSCSMMKSSSSLIVCASMSSLKLERPLWSSLRQDSHRLTLSNATKCSSKQSQHSMSWSARTSQIVFYSWSDVTRFSMFRSFQTLIGSDLRRSSWLETSKLAKNSFRRSSMVTYPTYR